MVDVAEWLIYNKDMVDNLKLIAFDIDRAFILERNWAIKEEIINMASYDFPHLTREELKLIFEEEKIKCLLE
jgi:hypothetical protein